MNKITDITKQIEDSLNKKFTQFVVKADYENAFKILMININCYLNQNDKIDFENIEYLNGYFIIEREPSSIVHFKVKQCPNWKFGLWWDKPILKNNNLEYTGTLFAQHELIIDKFKPGVSSLECPIKIVERYNYGESYDYNFNSAMLINFIHREPELAFCRDYEYWDYNTEYHSRKEAKKIYNKVTKRDQRKIKKLNDQCYKYLQKIITKMDKDLIIVDKGDNIYPRYDCLRLSNDPTEFGAYHFFECYTNGEYYKKKLTKYLKSKEKYSEKYKLDWSPEFGSSLALTIKSK